jgi:sensor histidine kinase YesM
MDWTRFDPLEVAIDRSFELFYIHLIGFIPATAVSLVYYLLLLEKKEREELFSSKYAEPYIAILLLFPIFILSIVNFASTAEDRMKLFYELLLLSLYFFLNACFFVKEKKNIKFIFLNLLSLVGLTAGTAAIYSLGFLQGNLMDLSLIFSLIFSLSFFYGYIRIKLKTSEKLFDLKLGAKESELSLLKSQVNPHFLFNTLNTIYATALEENASRTAESTAKVASLIRYMQNDINKDFIPLGNEVQYLKDFISIQKLRSGVPLDVKTDFKHFENKLISPGLLIPFVENAFKYGLNGSLPPRIFISLHCDERNIYFQCMNSYEAGLQISKTGEGFGIGIKNARNRLKLVYPKRHSLQIDDCGNIFKVDLQISIAK